MQIKSLQINKINKLNFWGSLFGEPPNAVHKKRQIDIDFKVNMLPLLSFQLLPKITLL
jgi:hypothetical protein